MNAVALAMRELGMLVALNGRRLLRAELQSRMKFVQPRTQTAAHRAPMARRSERRKVTAGLRKKAKSMFPNTNRKELREMYPWRPVPGYLGIEARDHKDIISAMMAKS